MNRTIELLWGDSSFKVLFNCSKETSFSSSLLPSRTAKLSTKTTTEKKRLKTKDSLPEFLQILQTLVQN